MFENILLKYPDLFKKGAYDKELFIWSFEYVLTRCYGWSLKYTCLIPYADLLNHNPIAVDHCYVNIQLENKYDASKKVEEEYAIKKGFINMDLIGISSSVKILEN